MELKQIEFFLKVYEEKNFTKASKALFITQQGLSRSIANLEKEFGFPLFNRTATAVLPTEYGQRLYHHFSQVSMDIQQIYQEVEHIRSSCAGELRIACIYGTFYCLDMSLILEFKNIYPDIKVYYEEFSEIDADDQLLKAQWDIGFLADPVDQTFFYKYPVFREPIYAYAHKNHPLAAKERISYQDLTQQPLLLYPPNHKGRISFDKFCREHHICPNIIFESPYTFNHVPLLEQNQGITLSTPSVIKNIISDQIVELPLDWEDYWSISVAWRKDSPLSFPAKLFLNFIKDRYKQK